MSTDLTPRSDAAWDYANDEEGIYAEHLYEVCCVLERELSDSLLEIDVLRRFGNKDCTAMADEELSNLRNPTTP